MAIETERLYRVFDNEIGGYIEVGPDGDGPGLVMVRTTDEAHYGRVSLTISRDMARHLAAALENAADEAAP